MKDTAELGHTNARAPLEHTSALAHTANSRGRSKGKKDVTSRRAMMRPTEAPPKEGGAEALRT